MSHAGADALELSVADKTFTAADGTRLTAIAGVAFTAPAGSITALVGPSGCGKTTLLRIVLGLDGAYTGHVRHPAGDGRMAAVFQEPRLLPWRTVEANVRLALPAALAATDLGALFATLGLAEMRERFPGELSLGLARRVALARAFAVRPSLLLLDEPFVSLDEATAERLRALLLAVWAARPTTALMVTHNLREALALADRIVVLTERPARVARIVELATRRDERDAGWLRAATSEFSPA